MTRLPTESWDIRPRTDLEPYELNETCAVCGAGDVEDHHIFRRSFLIDKEAFWVELPDGAVVPHRVGLCRLHHRLVTENVAHFVLEADKTYVYDNPSAGTSYVIHVGPLAKGKKCSKCKGAGVEPPAPEKKQQEKPRVKQTFSFRVPKDAENGAELIEDLLGQAKEILLPAMGWKKNVPAYYVVLAVFYDFLTSRQGAQ